MLTRDEIQSEVERLAPFHHNMQLPHGLSTYVVGKSEDASTADRYGSFVQLGFPPLLRHFGGTLRGKRVLDVACNCGGFSIEAAKHGAENVLGFDVVDRYLEQANLLKRAHELENVEFKKLSVEEVSEETVGERDITLCLGILYHLEDPILAFKKLAAVTTSAILVDTAVARLRFRRNAYWLMKTLRKFDGGTTGRWRTEAVCQLVPTEKAVFKLLNLAGFSNIQRITPEVKGLEKRYYTKTRLVVLATRS